MNIKIYGLCTDVTFDNNDGCTNNNSDSYKITLKSKSQRIEVNGVEQEEIELTIVGNMELNDFLGAMKIIEFVKFNP